VFRLNGAENQCSSKTLVVVRFVILNIYSHRIREGCYVAAIVSSATTASSSPSTSSPSSSTAPT
jgi:hypothetical protein